MLTFRRFHFAATAEDARKDIQRNDEAYIKIDNWFILTTDADVQFTPNSVRSLLDLMVRDPTVGAVCARTHPIGFGPMAWYQVFEYAIGHWFQKVHKFKRQ